jgi:osmotically-inducible protein OsmY
MTPTIGKRDEDLKIDVLAELEFDPSVKVIDIGVVVKDGIVTLNGYAASYGERFAAVRCAKRVAGLKAVADNIEVRLPNSLQRTDGEIASAAIDQLDLNSAIPKGVAEVTVRDGWVTLQGELEWRHAKDAAENVLHHVPGVKGVTNLMTIKPATTSINFESDIKSAFARNALLDTDKIQIEAADGKITLRGNVRNYAEFEEAERVAWAARGVVSVDNQLDVVWFWGEG